MTLLREDQQLAALAIMLYSKLSPQFDVLRQFMLLRFPEDAPDRLAEATKFFDGALFGIATGFAFSEDPNATIDNVLPIAQTLSEYMDEFFGKDVVDDPNAICKQLVPDAFVEKPDLHVMEGGAS